MQGFIILDFIADFAEAGKQLAVWVTEGKIKSKNTVIKGGLEKAPYALVDLLRGANTGMRPGVPSPCSVESNRADAHPGKLVVEVKAPSEP